MTEAPDYKTFDLEAAISGRTYPEDTVDVFFDENSAYQLTKVGREADRAGMLGEDEKFKALEEKLAALRKKFQNNRYVFRLRGVPSDTTRAITLSEWAKLEEIPEGPGRTEAAVKAEEAINSKMWAAHIVSITSPDGTVAAGISPEEVEKIILALPDFSKRAVKTAIDQLTEFSSAGYETAISDIDFLSDASPGA